MLMAHVHICQQIHTRHTRMHRHADVWTGIGLLTHTRAVSDTHTYTQTHTNTHATRSVSSRISFFISLSFLKPHFLHHYELCGRCQGASLMYEVYVSMSSTCCLFFCLAVSPHGLQQSPVKYRDPKYESFFIKQGSQEVKYSKCSCDNIQDNRL